MQTIEVSPCKACAGTETGKKEERNRREKREWNKKDKGMGGWERKDKNLLNYEGRKKEKKGGKLPLDFSVSAICVPSYFRHRVTEEGKEDEEHTGRM